jgi:hypothetical protein
MGQCVVCGCQLKGKQTKFCGSRCKVIECNNRHQSYLSQKERSKIRKLALVNRLGGKCHICGYSKNLASLCFHHKDPSTKFFSLDARSLSNRKRSAIEQEADKCDLLCANCHAEHHNPQMNISQMSSDVISRADSTDPFARKL